jgi:hypothetical protein
MMPANKSRSHAMATFSESENRMKQARKLLGSGYTVERCRHKTVTDTALWVFRDGVQVGSITLFDGASEWKANRMHRGMPTSERRYAELADACSHITEV